MLITPIIATVCDVAKRGCLALTMYRLVFTVILVEVLVATGVAADANSP